MQQVKDLALVTATAQAAAVVQSVIPGLGTPACYRHCPNKTSR